MRPEDVDDIYPLTPMQQLMLTHTRSMPGSFVLSNQFQYRLTGPLDAARFEAALAAIQARHPALRTFFLWEGLREPMQLVHPAPRNRFEFVDLEPLDERGRAEKLKELIADDRVRPFDIRKPPLSRFLLIRLESRLHHLVWSRHHLILDRWCVDILFEELFRLYAEGERSNGEPHVAPRGFRDYVAWIARQDREAAHAYWRRVLGDLERPTLLTDPRAPRTQQSSAGLPDVDLLVDEALQSTLAALARRSGVSLAIVLQAGLALLVARRTNRREAVFGVTVSGRPADLPGVESIMGSFINNVPVRIAIPEDEPVTAWFRKLQVAQAERVRFDYLSPADIVRASRVPSGVPAFDVLALLQSPPEEQRRGPGFEVEQLPGVFDGAHPFTLSLAETLGRLRLTGAYDPACISRDDARQLLGDLRDILADLVNAGDTPIGELPPTGVRDARSAAADYAPATGVEPAAPSAMGDGIAGTIERIWARTLGLTAVGLDDDFFALGGTSLQAIAVLEDMQTALGRALPTALLLEAGSIRGILARLDAPEEPAGTLVRFQSRGARAPLFVVPGVGGDPVALARLARALGPAQPFFGFQSSGLDGRERPLTRIAEMASQNIDEMRVEPGEEYVLCGVCWGALVALEMAQQLREQGRAPALLVVVDPTYQAGGTLDVVSRDPSFALLRFVSGRLRLYWTTFRDAPPGQRWPVVREKLGVVMSKLRRGSPLEGNASEINRERVIAANVKALFDYEPQPYGGQVHAVFTTRQARPGETDPRFVWLEKVSPRAPVSRVPGLDTGDVLSGSNLHVFAEKLGGIMAAGLADDPH